MPCYKGGSQIIEYLISQIVLSNFPSLCITSNQKYIAGSSTHSQPAICTEGEDQSKALVLSTDIGGSQVAQQSKSHHDIISSGINLGEESTISFQLDHFTR